MGKIAINIATGSLQQNEMIVGIDLGTTNSLVAIIHPETKHPVALKEHNAGSLVPSIVHFDKLGYITVGEIAKKYLETEPENTIFSVKRLMGKSYHDIASNAHNFTYTILDDDKDTLVKVKVGDTFYSPIELSSFILKELKTRAEHILKTPVSKAVITVPAYFNDAQRQATRDAGKLAGLDVLRIVNEPTAASLAYGLGLNKEEEKIIAVYDLGGGTFDISILRISNGIFEVLSTNGDTYLGGDDIDRILIDYWMNHSTLDKESIFKDKSAYQQIRILAEEAKKALSSQSLFSVPFGDLTLTIELSAFENLITPLIDKTIICCQKAIKDSGVQLDEIKSVVMVGGSTRIPSIKKAVASLFNQPVNDSVNPDEVVALGAAIQADILAGNNKDLLLLDITPLSLGIETMGGLMDVLIPRNTTIPTKVARQYTTSKDGQGSLRISVFQGERDLVKDNRKLAEFSFTGIPGMPAGLPKIEVSFLVNADGILVVKAKELRSSIEQSIEVKPQYGLSDSEVEQMLLDSISNAKNDMQTRALVEAQTEGKLLIETVRNFLTKNTRLIEKEEQETSLKAIQALEESLATTDKNLIQSNIESLNFITKPFAERLMDEAIAQAMKGKVIE